MLETGYLCPMRQTCPTCPSTGTNRTEDLSERKRWTAKQKPKHRCDNKRPVINGDVQGHVISASVEGIQMIGLKEPVLITITIPYVRVDVWNIIYIRVFQLKPTSGRKPVSQVLRRAA